MIDYEKVDKLVENCKKLFPDMPDYVLWVMGRSQLGKTTASVSSYWALLHHYKRPFFFFFSIFEKIWG
jgi:hypothetical protein